MVEYNLRDAFKSLEEVDDSIVAKEKRIIKHIFRDSWNTHCILHKIMVSVEFLGYDSYRV